MKNFALFNLDDIRKFCLCSLKCLKCNDQILGNAEYFNVYHRDWIWKILKCNKILKLVVVPDF